MLRDLHARGRITWLAAVRPAGVTANHGTFTFLFTMFAGRLRFALDLYLMIAVGYPFLHLLLAISTFLEAQLLAVVGAGQRARALLAAMLSVHVFATGPSFPVFASGLLLINLNITGKARFTTR